MHLYGPGFKPLTPCSLFTNEGQLPKLDAVGSNPKLDAVGSNPKLDAVGSNPISRFILSITYRGSGPGCHSRALRFSAGCAATEASKTIGFASLRLYAHNRGHLPQSQFNSTR